MNKVKAPSADSGQDRTTFVGALVPLPIKQLPKQLAKCDDASVSALLKAIASEYEGTPPDDGFISKLAATGTTDEDSLHRVFGGLRALVAAALRHPPAAFKKQVFADDLQYLGLETKVSLEIQKIVYGAARTTIETKLEESRIRLPNLVDMKWRVDVAISTSELQRAMKPAVLIQMTLSDGTIETFEMPVEEFHKLRYNVSYVLKEMEDLEKRGVMQKD